MRTDFVKAYKVLSTLILLVSTACSGLTSRPDQLAQGSIPPATQIPLPTITTYPTYTPIPTRTNTPEASPSPEVAPTLIPPTDIAPTSPVNCITSISDGYNSCTDDSGSITLDLPNSWTEINGSTWTYKGENIGYAISAAPSLEAFQSNQYAEGIFFGASGTYALYIGYIELLDPYTMAYRDNCIYDGRIDYNDGIYRGAYDKYRECGGPAGNDAYVLSAREIKEPSSLLILVEIQVSPENTAIVNHIFNTFLVIF